MNKIKEVKDRVDIVEVAKYFGIDINRSNKAKCCFHNEKTPSMSFHKEKQIFKCFGCGIGGDVIKLVSEILHINTYESAKKINDIFNLGVDFKKQKTSKIEEKKYKNEVNLINKFREWGNKIFQDICDYFQLLRKWEDIKDFENDLFVEALKNKDYIEYLIDEVFINGNDEDKIWMYKNNKKLINKIKIKLENERRKEK